MGALITVGVMMIVILIKLYHKKKAIMRFFIFNQLYPFTDFVISVKTQACLNKPLFLTARVFEPLC